MSAEKKRIREEFRDAVFERDHHSCVLCWSTWERDIALDAHHITPRENMPSGGYVPENGITLCDKPNGCHARAEAYLRGEEKEIKYSPEALYKAIGSSLVVATQACDRLRKR